MRIALTGAAGNVGRHALEALDGHDVTPFTYEPADDIDGVVLDVEDRAAVETAFDGHDAVVHLAANSDPDADWDALVGPNVEGAYNVYHAVATTDVRRVVFASSNHVQQNHVFDGAFDVADFPETPRSVVVGDDYRPDSYYGVSKVTGEALGRYHADRDGLEVVNLRIGWLLTEDELRARQGGDDDVARFARALWLSPRDCRDGIRKAATEPLDDTPVTANLLSENSEAYFSLVEARCGFDYAPRDDSADVVAEHDDRPRRRSE